VVRGPALGAGTKLIDRPRLLARLGEPWKAAVLAAPAGYGKTLLAAQFTADGGRGKRPGRVGGGAAQVVWCRLYPEDRDPIHLIESLLAAGARTEPSLWSATRRLFAAQRDFERDGALITRSLLDELEVSWPGDRSPSSPSPDIFLVLDDLQEIAEARGSLRWLARLVEDSPPRVRFLVTCRGECPLPLGRVRSLGLVVELTAADLAFSESEESELLATVFQLDLAAAEHARLRRTLSGWPAGVALAAQEHLRTGASILPDGTRAPAGPGATDRGGPLLELMEEAVLEPLPPATRRALIAVSVLDELDPEAMRAVLGDATARALSSAIARQDLFVQSFAEPGSGGRLHPMLHALLRRQFLAELSARERRQLLGRAARFWIERRQPARAIRLLSEGGATAAAARLLERTARAQRARLTVEAGALAALAQDLSRQEPTALADSPWLLLLGGVQDRDGGRFDDAAAKIEDATTGFLARRDYEGVLQSLRAHGLTAIRSGRLTGAIRHLERTLVRFPAGKRALRGVALLHLAELQLHAGDRATARRNLRQAERILAGGRQGVQRAEAAVRLAEVDYTEGRWESYLALVRGAIPVFQHAGYHTRVQSILINMAEACIYLGEEGRAIAHLDEARALRSRSGRAENQLYEVTTRAYALTELGRSAEAAAMLAVAKELAERFGSVLVMHTIAVRSGILARRSGQLAAAHTQLSAAVDGFSRMDAAAWLTFARMERALVTGLLGDPTAALAELAAAARDSRRLGDQKELARNWLYQARVELAGELDFRPSLRRGLRLLDRERYLPILARKEGELLLPLLVPRPDEGRDRPLLTRARAALPDAIRTRLPRDLPLEKRTPGAASVRSGTAAAPVTLRLLGGFAALRGGEPCRFTRRPSAAIVAYLALHPGTAIAREALAEVLWPGAPPAASRNRFDVALALARRALEPDAGARGPFLLLRSESGLCRLDPRVTVDVAEFERLADQVDPGARKRARGSPPITRASLLAATQAYGGDLLPEFAYASWVAGERERLRSRFHRVTLELGRSELAANRPDEAEAAARRVLDDDPLAEDAAQVLLRALAARGDRAGLTRSYRAFAKRMSRELDLDPSPDTAALFTELSGEGAP
jgi:DNA-binding SARP family transcriptional activator